MAICGISYVVMRSLRQQNALREGARMLEMGESNWYGDVPLEQLAQDIRQFVSDEARRDALLAELTSITASEDKHFYQIAKIYFRGLAGCASVESIDPGTSGSEYKFDLNGPVPLDQRYDLLVNYGTGEHIFNVCQFYKTVHDLTRPGGLMIHHAAVNGWIDHGFYSIQPTLYFDLALANQYEVVLAIMAELKPFKVVQLTHRDHVVELAKSGQLPANAMMEVVLRKPAEAKEFAIPMQGYYAGALSQQAKEAWHKLR